MNAKFSKFYFNETNKTNANKQTNKKATQNKRKNHEKRERRREGERETKEYKLCTILKSNPMQCTNKLFLLQSI